MGRDERQSSLLHTILRRQFFSPIVSLLCISSRPGHIVNIVNVPFKRTREASIRIHSDFQEIRGALREMLESEG